MFNSQKSEKIKMPIFTNAVNICTVNVFLKKINCDYGFLKLNMSIKPTYGEYCVKFSSINKKSHTTK